METYHDNWNACLLFRNKQLTKQLKEYQNASVLAECSSSLLVSLGQLLRLHQNPSYGIIREETEWTNLFTVIDMFYGGCLSEQLSSYGLSMQELKVCYLIRARLGNKAIAVLFNITPCSVTAAEPCPSPRTTPVFPEKSCWAAARWKCGMTPRWVPAASSLMEAL